MNVFLIMKRLIIYVYREQTGFYVKGTEDINIIYNNYDERLLEKHNK